MADPIGAYIKIIRADIHKHWGGFFSNCPEPIKTMRQVIDHPGVLASENAPVYAVLQLAIGKLEEHGLVRKDGVYVAETDEAKKYVKTTRGQFYLNHLTNLEKIILQQNKRYEQEQAAATLAPSMKRNHR